MMVASPGSPASPPHRSGVVDLWRALACLAVLAYHAQSNYSNADLHPSVTFLNRAAEHGYLGVRIFFVLSGYCLAEAIERRARRGNADASAFWQDRFLRIFPAYWAALVFTVVVALAALPFNGLPLSSVLGHGPLVWLANLTLTTEWARFHPVLGVSWSLDYEVGFYLLVGLALLSPRASTASRLACYALITAVSHLPGVAAGFPLLSFWPAFACGIVVRLALDPKLPFALRAALLAYPAGLLLFASGDACVPPAFAGILFACLVLESRLPAPPRVLLQLGAASYSIYLAHIPVTSPAANLARRLIPPESPAYLCVWFGQILLGIAAGLLFFLAVERPCERLRVRLRPRTSP